MEDRMPLRSEAQFHEYKGLETFEYAVTAY